MSYDRTRAAAVLWLTLLAAAGQAAGQQRAGELRLEPFTLKGTDGRTLAAERGRLLVPERHANPSGRLIELAFVRYKSSAAKPDPPVVYLAGGPGGSGIEEAARFFPIVERLSERADVIALDQRGTGAARPYLGCESVISFDADALASKANLIRFMRASLRPCAEHWRAQGVELAAYNTNESADDLDDLRRALGAKKISLWGYSYGTHLAFAAIKRHGASLHRLVLAGAEGPGETLKLPRNIQAQLHQIARLVKSDPALSRNIPDFLGLVQQVLAALARRPVQIEVRHAQTGRPQKLLVGAYALQLITALGLGRTNEIANLPLLYYSISRGELTPLARAVQRLQFRVNAPFPWAMHFAMDCASGAAPRRLRQIGREERQCLLGDAANFTATLCDVWPHARLGATFRSPARANLPVLFISGTLDSNTPVRQADEIGRGFPNSQRLIIEAAGHEDLLTGPQVADAITNFLGGRPLATGRIALPPVRFPPLDLSR